MDRCESTARLLECDELDLLKQSVESEEYSSGYDSAADSSDVDGTGSEACGPRDNKDDVGEVKRYRSAHALCGDLKYILSMPEMCDIRFLVGEKKIPVYGVKAILATRSKVFYSLILDIQRQKELAATSNDKRKHGKETTHAYRPHLVIQVNKYKPEDFRRIIQFVHCGTVDINAANVVGLYCGAAQFGLSDLKPACWDYIQRSLRTTPTLITRLTDEIKVYSQHKSSQRLLRKITENGTSSKDKRRCSSEEKETFI